MQLEIIAALRSNKIAALQLTVSEMEKASAIRALSRLNEQEASRNKWRHDLAKQFRGPLESMGDPGGIERTARPEC